MRVSRAHIIPQVKSVLHDKSWLPFRENLEEIKVNGELAKFVRAIQHQAFVVLALALEVNHEKSGATNSLNTLCILKYFIQTVKLMFLLQEQHHVILNVLEWQAACKVISVSVDEWHIETVITWRPLQWHVADLLLMHCGEY